MATSPRPRFKSTKTFSTEKFVRGQTQELTDVPGKAVSVHRPTHPAVSKICPELSPTSKLTQSADSLDCPEVSSDCADINRVSLITAAAVPGMLHASHDDDAQTEVRLEKSTEFGHQTLEQQRLDPHTQEHLELTVPTSSLNSWSDGSLVWTVKINKVRETVGSTPGHAGHDQSFLAADRTCLKQLKETHQNLVVADRVDRKQMKEAQNRAAEAQSRAYDARSNREAAGKHQQKPTKATDATLTHSNVNRLSPKHASNVVSPTRMFRNHSGDRSRENSRSPTFSSLPSSPIKKPAKSNLQDGAQSRDKNKNKISNSENFLNIQSKYRGRSGTTLNISQQKEIVPVQQPMEAYAGEAKSTKNKQDGARNIQHRTKNMQSGTGNIRHGTKNIQGGTKNIQDGTTNIQDGTMNIRDEIKNIQNGTRNLHNGTRNLHNEAKKIQDGEKNEQDGMKNIQQDKARNIQEKLEHIQVETRSIRDDEVAISNDVINIPDAARNVDECRNIQDDTKIVRDETKVDLSPKIKIQKTEKSTSSDVQDVSSQPSTHFTLACHEDQWVSRQEEKRTPDLEKTSDQPEESTILMGSAPLLSCDAAEMTDMMLCREARHSHVTSELSETKLLTVTVMQSCGRSASPKSDSPQSDVRFIEVTDNSQHSPATADSQLAVTNASMIHPESSVMLVGSGSCTKSSMSDDERLDTSVNREYNMSADEQHAINVNNDTFRIHFDRPSSYSCDGTTPQPAADRETLNLQQWTTPSSKPRNIVQERTSESIAEMNELWHMIQSERQDSSNREVGTHLGSVLNKEVGTDVNKLRSMKLQDSFMNKSDLDLDSLILLLPQLEKEYPGSSFVQGMDDELGPSHGYGSYDDDENKDLYEEKLERALRESEHLLAELGLLSK